MIFSNHNSGVLIGWLESYDEAGQEIFLSQQIVSVFATYCWQHEKRAYGLLKYSALSFCL